MATLAGDVDVDLETAIPGLKMSHVLTVVSGGGVEPAIAILKAVAEAGARLEGLTLAVCDNAFSHRVRIAAVSPRAARALSDKLSALPGVRRSTVEHHLGPAAAAAPPACLARAEAAGVAARL